MPITVITPTRPKSVSSVSWTSANCDVGPARCASAPWPNAVAPPSSVAWIRRATANAPPE